jgi:hypothetical protein
VVQDVVVAIVVIDVTVERITVNVFKNTRPSFSSFLEAAKALLNAIAARKSENKMVFLISVMKYTIFVFDTGRLW